MAETEGERRARLPCAVYDLAMRLGIRVNDKQHSVSLTQTGQMKRDLGSDEWMAFTANLTISTSSCEFDWHVKAGPWGLISGRDALIGGEGRLDIKLLGIIPVAHAEHTPALVRGELMRYLAELAWAPGAIFANTAIRWRTDAPDTFSVSAGAGEAAAEVFLKLGSNGHIASAFAPDRPRAATAPILPTPWQGEFSDYRLHHDIWLPFSGEVAWIIDSSVAPYWKCRIENWTTVSTSKSKRLNR